MNIITRNEINRGLGGHYFFFRQLFIKKKKTFLACRKTFKTYFSSNMNLGIIF